MEAHNRYYKCIHQYERTLLRIVGHDILASREFQRTPMTYIIYAMIFMAITMETYTILHYGILAKIFCLCTFSVTFQALVKLFYVLQVDEFQWVTQFVQNVYKAHIKTKSSERLDYFRKFSLFTEILFFVLIFLYLSSTCLFLIYPLYMYVTQNELVPILPLFIPMIDENTTTGFAILTIIHMCLLVLSITGFLAFDYYIAVLIISTLMFAKTISFDMDEIHLDLLENETKLDANARFRNILQMHQEIFEYMERIDKITLKPYFAQVGGSSLCVVFLSFAVLTMHYLPFYTLFVGFLIEIFIACLLGQFIELSFDQIYTSALALKWNELPLKEQRLYKLFIFRCQNPALLTVGGFAPLNLSTCVSIFSKIYNMSMIIYQTMAD